jgi:hypothetical protein
VEALDGDVYGVADGKAPRFPAIGGEDVIEGIPVHILHDEVQLIAFVVEIEKGYDVGMGTDARVEQALSLDAAEDLARSGAVGPDRLDGDAPVKLGVFGQMHLTHGA